MKRTPQQEAGHLRKNLKQLTGDIGVAVKAFDKVADEPQSEERGKKLAAIMNAIELANDRARHFGLGEPLYPKE